MALLQATEARVVRCVGSPLLLRGHVSLAAAAAACLRTPGPAAEAERRSLLALEGHGLCGGAIPRDGLPVRAVRTARARPADLDVRRPQGPLGHGRPVRRGWRAVSPVWAAAASEPGGLCWQHALRVAPGDVAGGLSGVCAAASGGLVPIGRAV